MLKYRLLTALILIPFVVLAIFFLPNYWFACVAALLIALAAWEWAPLFSWHSQTQRCLYVTGILVAVAISQYIFNLTWLILLIGSLWWLFATALLITVSRSKQTLKIPPFLIATMGFLVLIPCWEALVVLHKRPLLLLFLLIMVWIADSAAYFGGRLWGNRKLAPKISPKKTLEGVYTSLVVTLFFTWSLHSYLPQSDEKMLYWLVWTVVTVFASVLGDLLESFLKRLAGVKDSGQLLPGHGGILDRIDSLTAAAPIFLLGVLGLGLA